MEKEKNIRPVFLEQAYNEYGLIFKYYNKGTFEKQIHYRTSFSFAALNTSKYKVTVNKDTVYFNNQGPDLVSEQLSEALGKPLYPLELEVSSQMELIRLANFNKIKERWDNSKEQIRSYYVGKSSEKVISLMESAYSHSLHIRQIVKKNLFFDLYFLPFIYQEDYAEVLFNIFPFIPPVAYRIESRETYRNRAGKTVVHLKGICTDKRSLKDIEERNRIILNKEPELSGILNLKYKLNEQNHTLYSLIGELTAAGGGSEIRKIEIECFQLN